MIYNNIDFFNVASIERKEGIPGFTLQRYPKKVRNKMGLSDCETGRFKAQTSSGCEIRFVTGSRAARLVLTALECDGDICVYIGDYFHSMHHLAAGVAKPIFIDLDDRFLQFRREGEGQGRFSNNL